MWPSLFVCFGSLGEGIPRGRRLGGVLGGYTPLIEIKYSKKKKIQKKNFLTKFGHIKLFTYLCLAILSYPEFLSWYTPHQGEEPALIGVYFLNKKKGYPSTKNLIDERCFPHRGNCEKVKGKEGFGKLQYCNRRGIISLYGKDFRKS